ncbi:Pycsar system effector family protein [Niabella insulamsoli]|uniref:Pycsar system effector family protein n=1 Tax=Niabella insulamsoli TaxID=3144874 RepID=UPI0031FE2898
MNYFDLSDQVKKHVEAYFHAQEEPLVYHNFKHTEGVVLAAIQIANHYQLHEKDYFIVTTAAWFHDAGYFLDYANHEQKSAELARDFLDSKGIDQDTIEQVVQCILATKMPQKPTGRLEEIVCDADLFHFGTDAFRANNKLMRLEVEGKKQMKVNKADWRKNTISLLKNHSYFTDYCRALLDNKKRENLEALLKRDEGEQDPAAIEKAENWKAEAPTKPKMAGAKKAASEKAKRPDRGIETMFRITSGNNQRLSDMADNKAQIMITVNSIIISAILSLLLRKLDDNENLIIPTYIILVVSVVTIVFSILATRPNLPKGEFDQKDIDDKKVNLLFFGNFYRMDLEQYTAGMRQVMEDRDFLYGTLIKDVFSQGVVLGRKYKLLRISYNIFMFGLIISVLAFVIATLFN